MLHDQNAKRTAPSGEVLCYFQETTFGGVGENVGKSVGVVMAALAVVVHV